MVYIIPVNKSLNVISRGPRSRKRDPPIIPQEISAGHMEFVKIVTYIGIILRYC